ncbi:DUF3592 domain-containing protein [Weeksellaceae bacterium TAE3-ERU29]|nr:DUF3592 domain-containing protein [Weeksellaceae bacterium TAE3-ERU29]
MKINFENWDLGLIPTIIICIILPMLLYFSYWLFITGIIGAIRMIQSKNWKSVQGKIIDSEIKFKMFKGGVKDSYTFEFVLIKTYSYSVAGKGYKSNQTFASDSLFQNEYRSLVDFPKKYKDYANNSEFLKKENEIKHLIGRPVTVYYNPKNPQIACLENRIQNEIFLPVVMGLIFGTGLTYLTYCLLKVIVK